MTTLRELQQRREAHLAEMRIIQAAPAGEEGYSDEQEASLTALREKVEKAERSIGLAEFVNTADRRAQGAPLNGGSPRPEFRVFGEAASPKPEGFDGAVLDAQDGSRVPVLEARHKLADFTPAEARSSSLSFGQFLRALYLGPQKDGERRALAESSIGTGGAMVPTPMAAGIIDMMRAQSVAFRAGVRTVPMDSQTLKFARLISMPVGGWRAENSPIVEDQPAFDQVTLTAKSWALLTKINRELLEDGSNTDSVLRTVFANSAALALDQAILYGPGIGNAPLGIANTPGIQTIQAGGANGAALTGWTKVLDAVAALEAVNAGTVTAMVAAPRTGRTVYGFVDTTGQPLTLPPQQCKLDFARRLWSGLRRVADKSADLGPQRAIGRHGPGRLRQLVASRRALRPPGGAGPYPRHHRLMAAAQFPNGVETRTAAL